VAASGTVWQSHRVAAWQYVAVQTGSTNWQYKLAVQVAVQVSPSGSVAVKRQCGSQVAVWQYMCHSVALHVSQCGSASVAVQAWQYKWQYKWQWQCGSVATVAGVAVWQCVWHAPASCHGATPAAAEKRRQIAARNGGFGPGNGRNSWEIYEKCAKIMGKSWENHGKTCRNHKKSWKTNEKTCRNHEKAMKDHEIS
jgi:hypothetical protein